MQFQFQPFFWKLSHCTLHLLIIGWREHGFFFPSLGTRVQARSLDLYQFSYFLAKYYNHLSIRRTFLCFLSSPIPISHGILSSYNFMTCTYIVHRSCSCSCIALQPGCGLLSMYNARVYIYASILHK